MGCFLLQGWGEKQAIFFMSFTSEKLKHISKSLRKNWVAWSKAHDIFLLTFEKKKVRPSCWNLVTFFVLCKRKFFFGSHPLHFYLHCAGCLHCPLHSCSLDQEILDGDCMDEEVEIGMGKPWARGRLQDGVTEPVYPGQRRH